MCIDVHCLTFMRKLRTLLRTNKVAYVLGRRSVSAVCLHNYVFCLRICQRAEKSCKKKERKKEAAVRNYIIKNPKGLAVNPRSTP